MAIEIVDIRPKGPSAGDDVDSDWLRRQILAGLQAAPGQRTLPTLLLYNERGLRLYDDITTKAPEYYLFSAEEEILKNHADDIVHTMMHDAAASEVVLELGAGALRKTSLLLSALARMNPSESKSTNGAPVAYYALDLEQRELERTLEELQIEIGQELKGRVDIAGMHGTYDDGIRYVEEGGLQEHNNTSNALGNETLLSRMERIDQSPARDASPHSEASSAENPASSPPSTPGGDHPPLHLVFLGSSLGNFKRGEDVAFLRSLPLRSGTGDTLLLGLDRDNDGELIEAAYNDSKGHTKEFIMNGLQNAGQTLGNEGLFSSDKWEYYNRYDKDLRRHEAFYKSVTKQTITDPKSGQEITFLPDELINVEVSIKFSDKDAQSLFSNTNLRPIQRWTDTAGRYSLWLLERPAFGFPLLKTPTQQTTPFGVPSTDEWDTMWSAWDFITLRMIPPELLYQKPIDLRHICLFYIGHIPAFLDIHLSRLLQEPHSEPDYFKNIFERGIDPNVDDPTMCHDHSIVPQSDDEWPTLESILDFRLRVRQRLLKVYDDVATGKRQMTRKIARVLFITFEHEAMHAETLLYMLLQRAGNGTIPPPDFTPPAWESLEQRWNAEAEPAVRQVTLGPETVIIGHDDLEADDYDAEGHPVPLPASHEFGWDIESPRREIGVGKFKIETRPVTNGQFYEFYKGAGAGKVKLPKGWQVVDGEIRVRTFYGPVPVKTGWNWPVIADYNDMSVYAVVKGGRLPTEAELRLFYDKFHSGYEGGANVGFRNWHPVPATTGGARDGGRGHNGGVWEWTSEELAPVEGFVPSKLYPGYSSDFFDGCHNVVIGASYVTIPRMAERRSFRNWYQRNYGYAWVGGRVAYDITQ